MEQGADVSADNNKGDTPLLSAVAAGHPKLVKALLAGGASVEASREHGTNLPSLAIFSKEKACIAADATTARQKGGAAIAAAGVSPPSSGLTVNLPPRRRLSPRTHKSSSLRTARQKQRAAASDEDKFHG